MRLSLCLVWTVLGPAAASAQRAVAERRLVVMGTALELRVEAPDRASALAASESAVREIEGAESLLSTWKPGGPLALLNGAAPGQPVALPREVVRLLEEVFAWQRRTDGAFDPTVLPLVRAFDLRGSGRWPTSSERARAAAAVGIDQFEFDCEQALAGRRRADAGIDEGAWGKGYALDRAASALRRSGVRSASLDLGGQVIVLGPGEVAVASPRERHRPATALEVEDVSVSTSGNSERGRIVGGRKIGHILDPRTGRPAEDFGSATAIAPSALAADVLSTAFFVLGPELGLAVSARLRRKGFPNEALFLVESGAGLRLRLSPELEGRVRERKR